MSDIVDQEQTDLKEFDTLALGISQAAHELRNPLAAISAYLAALEKQTKNLIVAQEMQPKQILRELSKLQHGLQLIRNQVHYSNSMIDILVTNAWKGKNKMTQYEVIAIHAVIEEAIMRYPFSEAQKNQLQLDLQHDFLVAGDANLLVFLFHNLIKNSLKSLTAISDRPGKIVIRTENTPQHCVIFWDNGIGIDPQHVPYLFQRFFSHPAFSGTGMGLSFCHEVMHEMGGEIRCRSEKDEFAEFTLVFPEVLATEDPPFSACPQP